MEKKGSKLLYDGISLETFLIVKGTLESNKVEYFEQVKRNDSWFRFFIQILIVGTGSRGMNAERITHYYIYVSQKDYDAAKRLIGETCL